MPEIELHGNTMDSIWILALMTFPDDEDLRRQYYAVKFAESELQDTVPTDFIEMEVAVIQELIDAPGKSDFLEIVGRRTRDAIIAGNVLATIYGMDSFPNYFDEPSERKAIFVARKCPSSNKWNRSNFRLSECFARHFHITRRAVDSANGVSRWSFV